MATATPKPIIPYRDPRLSLEASDLGMIHVLINLDRSESEFVIICAESIARETAAHRAIRTALQSTISSPEGHPMAINMPGVPPTSNVTVFSVTDALTAAGLDVDSFFQGVRSYYSGSGTFIPIVRVAAMGRTTMVDMAPGIPSNVPDWMSEAHPIPLVDGGLLWKEAPAYSIPTFEANESFEYKHAAIVSVDATKVESDRPLLTINADPTVTQDKSAIMHCLGLAPGFGDPDYLWLALKLDYVVATGYDLTAATATLPRISSDPRTKYWPILYAPASWDVMLSSPGNVSVTPMSVSPFSLRPVLGSEDAYADVARTLPPAHAYRFTGYNGWTPWIPSLVDQPDELMDRACLFLCPRGPVLYRDFAWRPNACYLPLALLPQEWNRASKVAPGQQFSLVGVPLLSVGYPNPIIAARVEETYDLIPVMEPGELQEMVSQLD